MKRALEKTGNDAARRPRRSGVATPVVGPASGAGWLLAWAILLTGLGQSPAGATRFVPMTPEQMAAVAGLVIHGRVESVTVRRDDQGRIHTRVDVHPLELWKGKLESATCTIVAGGGILGESEVAAVGQVTYRVHEEVVAFLVRNPAGEWVTVGLAQGKFPVRAEEGTGRRWVSHPLWGWGDATMGGDPRRGVQRFPGSRGWTLDELRSRVREATR